MKTEVYSWRVSTELKLNLEREARLRKVPVSAILEDAARDWLNRVEPLNAADEEVQRQLHAAAGKCLGVIETGYPGSSTNVRDVVREQVRRRLGR